MPNSIRYLPTLPIMINEAIGTIVVGASASGKTFHLLNMAINSILMGQKIVAIDPKDDFRKILNVVPSDLVNLVDINDITDGSLNPFIFLDNCDELTLLTIIKIMSGGLSKDVETTVTPIIEDFIKESRRSGTVDMMDLVNYLYSHSNPNAVNLGTSLRILLKSKYGRLLYTVEKNSKPLDFSMEKSLIVSLLGLPVPAYNVKVDNFTEEERFTSAILYIITKKIKDGLVSKSPVPTTLYVDEAHLAYAFPELSKIIDTILSIGRSLNWAVVLASQGISNFPDNIAQYVSFKFMFKSSLDEAKDFLRRFDISKTDLSKAINTEGVIELISKVKVGSCFFIDNKGRSGFMRVKTLFSIDEIKTNPLMR